MLDRAGALGAEPQREQESVKQQTGGRVLEAWGTACAKSLGQEGVAAGGCGRERQASH